MPVILPEEKEGEYPDKSRYPYEIMGKKPK